MLAEHQQLFDCIGRTLSLRLEESIFPADDYHDIPAKQPINFSDRHLALDLQLRAVKCATDIPQLLASFIDKEISDHLSLEHGDDLLWNYQLGDKSTLEELSRGNSVDIADLYDKNFGTASRFAGQFYIAPHKDCWYSVVVRIQQKMAAANFLNFAGMELPHSWIKGTTVDISKPMLATLKGVHEHGPMLAIWHFFPYNVTGENILKSMKGCPIFQWETSRTIGINADAGPLHKVLPDSDITLMSKLGLSSKHGERISRVVQKSKSVRKTRGSIIPPPTSHTARPYRADSRHYIQHAWSQAVLNDSTFIIFNCGRYERICIRHRQSQTLYLSDLIDCTTRRGIPYSKIQIALQTAIVRDALTRHDKRQAASVPLALKSDTENVEASPSRKRKATEDKIPSDKRHKVDIPRRSDNDTIRAALSSRDLALISLNHDIYHSPRPSSFLRIGPSCISESNRPFRTQKSYSQAETFSLSLREQIGHGATGTVYRGTVSVNNFETSSAPFSVIAKLVFLSAKCDIAQPEYDNRNVQNPQKRLHIEYEMYQHLAKMGTTKGITPVYGLFEDPESHTLALIMGDGGLSLRTREKLTTGKFSPITTISIAERANALLALKGIHLANIRHRDIRSDNIVVNEKEEVFIIDFDLAEDSTDSKAKNRELECLEHILDGNGDTDLFYSFRY